MKSVKINAPKIIAASFFLAAAAGTALLSLPVSTVQKGAMPFIDALFTATSAVCVTGLITADTGSYFTHFGQMVILVLIQIGGLGIMTLSTFFLVLLGKRLHMKDLFVIEGSIGGKGIRGIRELIRYILFITFGFELLGAVVFFFRLRACAGVPPLEAAYSAVFHSVSAFCNAGFSLYSASLAWIKGDWITMCMFSLLIICGGLGFVVLLNINMYKFWEKDVFIRGRLKLQTKMAVVMSFVLVCAGFIGILVFEWNGTLNFLPMRGKIINSFFHSVTSRTAGFNTLPVSLMSMPALWLIMFLMFVGASPGSTGGGIKTTTFMILCANAYSIIKGKKDVQLFNRTIPKRVIQEATCIIGISLGFIFVFTLALLTAEPGTAFVKTFFEVISAFSNVGLSTGITAGLTNAGKVIIIITMFIGRISPLAMALVVGRRHELPAVGYATESVMVG